MICQGVIALGGADSGFYLQRLTLINPLVSSAEQTGNGFGKTRSALPLWAIAFTRSSGNDVTRLILESVTMVLPVKSFPPLVALATVGGPSALRAARLANPTWTALHDPSLDDITAFTVSRSAFHKYNDSNFIPN